ncbi:hypothetical protein [Planctomicrobium sp. SH527]|uniref:hypothetical protein n=1 Tax=Planctomicrobium sp. SH527 TaxID=3448123 RepID=UPI003F5C8B2F
MSLVKNSLTSLVLIAGVFLLQGCGGAKTAPTGSVSGKVTLADQPLSAVVVEFFSSELAVGAIGNTQEDGTYKIEGKLPVGSYVVTVNHLPPEPGQPAVKTTPVPPKYSNAKTSQLEFTVTSGANEFDLALTK